MGQGGEGGQAGRSRKTYVEGMTSTDSNVEGEEDVFKVPRLKRKSCQWIPPAKRGSGDRGRRGSSRD